MRSVLIIDDKEAVLRELKSGLQASLGDEVHIHTWQPVQADSDSQEEFANHIDSETTLVVTDEDLTASGRTGLFGFTIVEWCQSKTIPVGVYSRKPGSLPQEPSLFAIRLPKNTSKSVAFVASVFKGFRYIDQTIRERPQILEDSHSPAAVLAGILCTPHLESQYGLYSGSFAPSGGAFLTRIKAESTEDRALDKSARRRLVTYLVGHLLLNAILEFPGPIVSSRALAAYTGCNESEVDVISDFFQDAMYKGPFSDQVSYFWLEKVDERLHTLTNELETDFQEKTHGEIYRDALEHQLGHNLARHDCTRCEGRKGGFFCPFTEKAVCLQAECSVGSSSWIPQGARLCRIERGFYDEWAPVLGI